MNPDPKSFVEAALGLAMVFFGWMFKRHMTDFDLLVKNAVNRAELKESLELLREERTQMHAENISRFDRIDQKIEASSFAVMFEKVKNLEQDYGLLHQWKNVILPQQFERQNENFANLMKEIVRRLDRIEHKP